MTKLFNINPKFINKAAISRELGVSPEYVRMLLSGKRKNKKRQEQIIEILNKQLSLKNKKKD